LVSSYSYLRKSKETRYEQNMSCYILQEYYLFPGAHDECVIIVGRLNTTIIQKFLLNDACKLMVIVDKSGDTRNMTFDFASIGTTDKSIFVINNFFETTENTSIIYKLAILTPNCHINVYSRKLYDEILISHPYLSENASSVLLNHLAPDIATILKSLESEEWDDSESCQDGSSDLKSLLLLLHDRSMMENALEVVEELTKISNLIINDRIAVLYLLQIILPVTMACLDIGRWEMFTAALRSGLQLCDSLRLQTANLEDACRKLRTVGLLYNMATLSEPGIETRTLRTEVNVTGETQQVLANILSYSDHNTLWLTAQATNSLIKKLGLLQLVRLVPVHGISFCKLTHVSTADTFERFHAPHPRPPICCPTSLNFIT